ncbi:hypothetical protein KUTeg_009202 [Tegillarca granosa]|uniref:Small ribosomal subunit protein uS17 n=1 Tax=Tegillarca granosa TaxID=220873 RepID=A0ABQ9FC80_TEGGR|nr:hypothetical protein KUTeg_009202 [Tegillarca granosa]
MAKTERSFQKQPTVFLNKKENLLSTKGKKNLRHFKNVSKPQERDVQLGDIVTVGECRPLSKTVRYNTLKVMKSGGSKKSFSKF